MNDSLINQVVSALKEMFSNVYLLAASLLSSFFGYFLQVKDITNLLIMLFIIDVLVGFWAARKLRNERFSVKIIWSHTIPRMVLSVLLIMIVYMWDKTYNHVILQMHDRVGWFISGMLIYSIAENAYQITKWSVFPKIISSIKDRVSMQINKSPKNQNDGIEIKKDSQA